MLNWLKELFAPAPQEAPVEPKREAPAIFDHKPVSPTATLDDAIQSLVDDIIDVEAGFVDHPADRGGPTKYGITEKTARAFGYTGRMQDLPLNFARHVYTKQYITGPGFDQVLALSIPLGREVVDTGVNMGPARAGKFLQRWLNALNHGNRYPVLKVDGAVGPATISALKAYLSWRKADGEIVLLRGLNASQGAHYLSLAENDTSQRAFLFGWVRHRVVI